MDMKRTAMFKKIMIRKTRKNVFNKLHHKVIYI